MVANSSPQVSPAHSPRLRPGTKLVILTPFCLMILVLASCIGGDATPEPASDFQVNLFDGTSFRLFDQIGQRAVVLNFWFPSCPPCRAEMPDFEKAWQQVKDEDVLFLGLFVPQGFDTEQDAKDFVEELGLTYRFATDTGAQITLDYKLAYFPTTIFIDKSGRLVRTEISTLDAEKLTELVLDLF